MENLIGEKIGSYIIKAHIGEGGMGNVYLAEHTELGRKVAIKILLPSLMRSEQIRERFRQEATTMESLEHPNIVRLIDYIEQHHRACLIMEYVEGIELEKHIKNESGPIHPERLLILFSQILSAFAYAHKFGIVHRDVKPGNILVTKDDKIKIMDFGIAKILHSGSKKLTKTGLQMGTVYYMSPEQVKGKEVDSRTDIYSLGVTFFQMITGLSPYDSVTTEYEIYNKIIHEPLPPVRSIYPAANPGFDAIIAKATAKERSERFSDCEAFLEEVKHSVSTGGSRYYGRTPFYRKKAAWLAASGALLLLLVLGTWQYRLRSAYNQFIHAGDAALEAKQYRTALEKYEEAGSQKKPVLFPINSALLEEKTNTARFYLYRDSGESILLRDSFSISGTGNFDTAALHVFGEAAQFGNPADSTVSQRIGFYTKLREIMNRLSGDPQHTDLKAAYADVIRYAQKTALPGEVIARLERAGNTGKKPRAGFLKIWNEYDITSGGEKGMRVHINFETTFMQNRDCSITAWFYLQNGTPFPAPGNKFRTATGQVAVSEKFSVDAVLKQFDDFTLFIPYSAFGIRQTSILWVNLGIFADGLPAGKQSEMKSFSISPS